MSHLQVFTSKGQSAPFPQAFEHTNNLNNIWTRHVFNWGAYGFTGPQQGGCIFATHGQNAVNQLGYSVGSDATCGINAGRGLDGTPLRSICAGGSGSPTCWWFRNKVNHGG